MNKFIQRFLQPLLIIAMTMSVVQSSDLLTTETKVDEFTVGADFLATQQQPDLLVRRGRGGRGRGGRRGGFRRSRSVRRSRPRRARVSRVSRSRPRRSRVRRRSRSVRRSRGRRRSRRYRGRRFRRRSSYWGLGSSYYRPFYWADYSYYPWSYSLYNGWNWGLLGRHGHYSGWHPYYGLWYPKWRFYHFGGWGYYYPSSYWGYGFWMYPFQDSAGSKKVRFIVYDWPERVDASNRKLYFQNASKHDLHFGFYRWNERTGEYHRIDKSRVIASKAIGRIRIPRPQVDDAVFVMSRNAGDIGKRLDRNDIESLIVRDTVGSGDIQIKIRSGRVQSMSSRLSNKISKIEEKIKEDKRIFDRASREREQRGVPLIDRDSRHKQAGVTPSGASFRRKKSWGY